MFTQKLTDEEKQEMKKVRGNGFYFRIEQEETKASESLGSSRLTNGGSHSKQSSDKLSLEGNMGSITARQAVNGATPAVNESEDSSSYEEVTDSEEEEKPDPTKPAPKPQSTITPRSKLSPVKAPLRNGKPRPGNALQERRLSLNFVAKQKKVDLSWIERECEKTQVIGSMLDQLQKWVAEVKEFDPDPWGEVNGARDDPVLPSALLTDPYARLRDEIYTYEGQTDDLGKPHGEGTVTFESGDKLYGHFVHGSREGHGFLQVTSKPDLASLEGNYSNDLLRGKVKVDYKNGDSLYAWFESGTLHGYGKLYDKDRNLKRVGWCANGRPTGLTWEFLEGGGHLVGDLNVTGQLIGEDIAFLFPDLQTVLVGSFVKARMGLAQVAFVLKVALRNGMCQLKFTQPRGPQYSFDAGTEAIICKEPLLADPYEAQHCYVRQSRLKGAAEGLYAKKDLRSGTIVAFYNGTRVRDNALKEAKDDWEGNAYKILDLQDPDPADGTLGVLDIPPEYVSQRRYVASSAHKANHSFAPNARFTCSSTAATAAMRMRSAHRTSSP